MTVNGRVVKVVGSGLGHTPLLIMALSLTSSVVLSRFLHLFELLFIHLQNGYDNAYHTVLM